MSLKDLMAFHFDVWLLLCRLSVSSDLKEDAERDLADIGAKISVYPLNKVCIFSTPFS